MYDEAVLRIPRDEPELWEILRAQFFHAAEDFARSVETKQDALGNRFHRGREGEVRRDRLLAIRYRNVGNELDNREFFLTMGRELLPYIAEALDHEELTPEFVQQWGKLMFCHGYIASHILDDSDDLAPHRAGAVRLRDAQRKWIAHHIVPLIDAGLKRATAEARVVEHVQSILKAGRFTASFPKEWFEVMITTGELAATYDQKHFSAKAMRALLTDPADDIPSVTPLLP